MADASNALFEQARVLQGAALASLLYRCIAHPSFFSFGDLLDLPTVQSVSNVYLSVCGMPSVIVY